MSIITRENIRLPLRRPVDLEDRTIGPKATIDKTFVGTLSWDTEERLLELIDPATGETLVLLSGRNGALEGNQVRLLDTRPQNACEGIYPLAGRALAALRTQGVIVNKFIETNRSAYSTIVELVPDLGAAAQAACTRTASVTLFKESGKYSATAAWRVPVNATGPESMSLSPDFRVSDGPILVDADAAPEFPDALNWGFPRLILPESE